MRTVLHEFRMFLLRIVGKAQRPPQEPRYYLCCARCKSALSEWFTSCITCGINEPVRGVWVPETDMTYAAFHDGSIRAAAHLRNAVEP